MEIKVQFFSYFKDLTGCSGLALRMRPGSSLGELHEQLQAQYPKLASMRKSTLLAVGVDYQDRDYLLQEGDEVSLFPPVQGG
jgi:molybdopterin converting factor small subunit